ncbi:MAG: hypothetical protein N3A38_16115 [Planctomycetota bacterium]|nr:hypothetical protein [Planctomycetota bacterium]
MLKEGDPFPIFFSVIHEGDLLILSNDKPPFRSVKEEPFCPMWLFDGPYFCEEWNGRKKRYDDERLRRR